MPLREDSIGEGHVRPAISEGGTGEDWIDHVVARQMGTCYTTIHEVEPVVRVRT